MSRSPWFTIAMSNMQAQMDNCLLNMRPCSSVDDMVDGDFRYIKSGSQFSLSNSTAGILLSDRADIVFDQSRAWIVRTLQVQRVVASFAVHVLSVVRKCSKKQMRGVTARRVKTTMQNTKTIWNWPKCKFVCETMGKELSSTSGFPDNSVSIFVFPSLPFPAIVRALRINTGIKAITRRYTRGNTHAGSRAVLVDVAVTRWSKRFATLLTGKLLGHLEFPSRIRGVVLPAVCAARGRFSAFNSTGSVA